LSFTIRRGSRDVGRGQKIPGGRPFFVYDYSGTAMIFKWTKDTELGRVVFSRQRGQGASQAEFRASPPLLTEGS